MTRQRVTTWLLVFAGVYILFQPFSYSPAGCISGWGGIRSPIALQNCGWNTPDPAPFLVGSLIGIVLVVVGVWAALAKPRSQNG